jgi:hypothetical protein
MVAREGEKPKARQAWPPGVPSPLSDQLIVAIV